MECNFTIGQKVVCVNDDENEFTRPGVEYISGGLDGLEAGKIYTISAIFIRLSTSDINVSLKEIKRKDSNGDIIQENSQGFHHARFAPLKEKKTDISVFNSIVNKINAGDHDNNYGFFLDELYDTVNK